MVNTVSAQYKGCFTSDWQTCERCKGHEDDSESNRHEGSKMPLLRAIAQRSREKQQKQQHISGAENILFKSCSTESVRNYDKSSSKSYSQIEESILPCGSCIVN